MYPKTLKYEQYSSYSMRIMSRLSIYASIYVSIDVSSMYLPCIFYVSSMYLSMYLSIYILRSRCTPAQPQSAFTQHSQHSLIIIIPTYSRQSRLDWLDWLDRGMYVCTYHILCTQYVHIYVLLDAASPHTGKPPTCRSIQKAYCPPLTILAPSDTDIVSIPALSRRIRMIHTYIQHNSSI